MRDLQERFVVPANVSTGTLTADDLRAVGSPRVLLDVHSDPDHARSVLTYAGDAETVVAACTGLVAWAVGHIDLARHRGVHPRLGAVDVLPVVPHRASVEGAVEVALRIGRNAADVFEIPVHLYGDASPAHRTLPDIRRTLPDPDLGPALPHPTAGRICVGVRGPLIAFNVNVREPLPRARAVVGDLRALPGVRALAFELASRGLVQLSMNLIDPPRTGPRAAFAAIAAAGLDIVDAEVVGLVPAASLRGFDGLPMRTPARSVEDALAAAGRYAADDTGMRSTT